MEVINILLLLLILYFISRSRSVQEKKLSDISLKLDLIEKEIKKLELKPQAAKPAEDQATKPVEVPAVFPEALPKPVPVEKTEPRTESINKPVTSDTIINSRPPVKEVPVPPKTEKPRQKSFFEKHPDLEKFIGENLINKIGIAILVLGIGFFVKYAIDQDWINEVGRVAIGILCGGILVAAAHKIRKEYKPFSSVLIGGGLAIFYLTIAIAFHQYHLFSQTAAFIIMVAITGFSVGFSLLYNRIELAVVAVVGGFASPFMVSTGDGNYIVLFTYILILNMGMLVLAYFKKWSLVNWVSYAFTTVLYGGWIAAKVYDVPDAPYAGAMIFGTLFYLVFFAMNIINNIKENRRFIVADISILISNTFLYYSAGMLILHNIDGGIYKGLFTAVIAVFNFIFAYTLFKFKKADKNLVYLLIGLVLTFVSLAAPVQLEGNHITLFWALEAVLLLWLSQKSGIHLMKAGSVIVTILMVISLGMDWSKVYDQDEAVQIVLNKGFVTGLVVVISLAASSYLLGREEKAGIYYEFFSGYKYALQLALFVLIYLTGFLEVRFQANWYFALSSQANVIIGSYNLAYILALMTGLQRLKSEISRWAVLSLGVIGTLAYLIFYHFQNIRLRNEYLIQNLSFGGYLYHYLVTAFAITIIVFCLRKWMAQFQPKSLPWKTGLWFFIAALLIIASAELDHLVLTVYYTTEDSYDLILNQNRKIGYALLWGLGSFILMIAGMKKKIKELRVISLTLFTITLLKLFILDIKGISEGGKIAAFICLGILLLVISFMYQKLKKLVTDDETGVINEL